MTYPVYVEESFLRLISVMETNNATPNNLMSSDPNYGIALIPLDDGKIIYFANDGNISREAVDYWWAVFSETINTWPENEPILLLHDFSHPGIVMTPYVWNTMQRSRNLIMQKQHEIHVAIVIADSLTMRLTSMLINQLSRGSSQLQEQICHSYESALDWLRQFEA